MKYNVFLFLIVIQYHVFSQNNEKKFIHQIDFGVGLQSTSFYLIKELRPIDPNIYSPTRYIVGENIIGVNLCLQYKNNFFQTQIAIHQPIYQKKFPIHNIIGLCPLITIKYGQNLCFYTFEAKNNGFHFGPSIYSGLSLAAGYLGFSPVIGYGLDLTYRNLFCGFSLLYCTGWTFEAKADPPLFHQAFIGYSIPHIFKKRTSKKER